MEAQRPLTLTVLCALAFWSIAQAGVVNVATCQEGKSDQLSAIKQVRVEGCTNQPCKFTKTHNYSVEIDIVPPADSKTLKVSVDGELFGARIGWVGFQKDACTYGHVTCPITAGKPITYQYSFSILSYYPSMNLNSYWDITGDNGLKIGCFKVNQTLVAKS